MVAAALVAQSRCDYLVSKPNKLVLKNSKFISYTNKALTKFKKYYPKDTEFITCNVQLADLGGTKIAYFVITIQSVYAYKNFGMIQKNKKLAIHLKNKVNVHLNLEESDMGKIDHENGKTTYRSYAMLTNEDMAKLESEGVHRVLIPWSEGVEIYPTANPQLFVDRIRCIQ